MDNWYEILGVPEDIEPDELSPELERLRNKALREHHPDRYSGEPEDVKAEHAAQLERILEGVSFLLSKHGPKILKEHLRQERAARTAEARRRSEAEAKRRGHANDQRAPYGARSRPGSGARSAGTTPPGRPLPVKRSRSPIGEADVVLLLDAYPPIDWGASAGRVGALAGSLALLASPFFIMSVTGAASNDHLSGSWAIELGCFALFVVGLVAVGCVLASVFSRD
jgi:curved DNA-binding protein CbpA